MAINSDDDALLAAVLAELAWDTRVDQSLIDIGVARGVVTLVGTVGSYAEKLAVQHAASTIEGVHDLINDIDVKPTNRAHPSDACLTEMAEQVLAWDAVIPEQHLTAAVTDGWIMLTGHVDVAAQRHEAELVLSRLAGVRGVTNQITVADPEIGPDEVRRAINQALQRRAAHRANHIDVTIDNRIVTLRGPTQTHLEKAAILGAVSHAPGIERICDELHVDPNT
jgi:osmotically-inducible protein OsmY